MNKKQYYSKKKKCPKRIGLREMRMSKNYYLNIQFVCHLCGELTPIKKMIMYPGTVMDIVPEMPRPYDGACYYCFHYELPLETQKKILEETIKQRTESYKCHCLTKRHGGFMAGGLFIPQWIDWSRISGKESTIGSMLYFRYLKQLLKDLENRMEILDE